MTLTLSLPPATLHQLESAATAQGIEVETYAASVLQKSAALAKLSFRELFAPLHAAVKNSGMTGDEVDQLLDDAIAESRGHPTAKP